MEREGLVHFPIRADFAWALVNSLSGGVNEWEVGRCCTNDAAAQELANAIEDALDNDKFIRDICLWITPAAAMCLAVASQNCMTHGLPLAQIKRIDEWHEKWKESPFATLIEESGVVPLNPTDV